MADQQQITLNQVDAKSLYEGLTRSISLGPFTIDWSIGLNPPQLDITVKLFGVQIAQIVLDAKNPTITIGGSVGPVTAEATLTFDVATMTLTYDVTLDFGIFKKHYTGSINL